MRQLAPNDPALRIRTNPGNRTLLDVILARPGDTARQLTVEALTPRAPGHALHKVLTRALTRERRKAVDRQAAGGRTLAFKVAAVLPAPQRR